MTSGGCALCTAVAAGMLALPAPADAQPAPRPPRAELALGGLFMGSMPIDDVAATYTRPDGGTLPLFTTDVSFDVGYGLEAQLGRRLGDRWAVELGGGWTRTAVRTRVSGDFEGAPGATATEDVSRFSVEGSALWTVAGSRDRSVFVRIGGGWMRELAGGGVLSEDGVIGSVGAGVKYWWRQSTPGSGRWGVRLDGRAVLRSPGIDLGPNRIRVAPAASASVLFGF
jgi:hypothetical protein